MANISSLQPQVARRLEEIPTAPQFWSAELEMNSGLMEAQCDLLLLVGRPNLSVSMPFTIQPNTPWQQLPKGLFCVTNIQGPDSEVWNVMLEDMDYSQVAGPDWEQDVGDTIKVWFPLGFSMFGVHPSVSTPQTVLLTGIASPITGVWPYDGTQQVVFHDEQFSALEKYAAMYCRIKEGTSEMSEGARLYQEYLADAKRLTELENRRDPFIFSTAVGAPLTSNPTQTR